MSKPKIIDTPAGPAQLKRTNRKTLAISVLPDGTLELAAPLHACIETILSRIDKRLRWIRTQRRTFREMNATRPLPNYVNGATHRYMGRQYRLKIVKCQVTEVLLKGAFFYITIPKPDENEVKKTLEAWYRRQSRLQFERKLGAWNEWCRHRKLPLPKLRVRSMPKRWGSALQDGTVCLNPELIRAPSACIDYVITHEICHLKHPNHGRGFFRLLQELCPQWEQLKQRLETAEL